MKKLIYFWRKKKFFPLLVLLILMIVFINIFRHTFPHFDIFSGKIKVKIGSTTTTTTSTSTSIYSDYSLLIPYNRMQSDYLMENDYARKGFSEGGISPADKSFSLVFWFNYDQKTNTLYKNEINESGNIFSLGKTKGYKINFTSKGDANRGINLILDFYGTAKDSTTKQSLTFLGIPRTLLPNNWYHVALVVDRENGLLKGYINGQVFPSNGHKLTEIFPAIINSDGPFTIGNGIMANDSYGSLGIQIDDLAVFKKALTQQEIISFYTKNAPPSFSDPDLMAFWTFNNQQAPISSDNNPLIKLNFTQASDSNLKNASPYSREFILNFDPDDLFSFFPANNDELTLFNYLKVLSSDIKNFTENPNLIDNLPADQLIANFGEFKASYLFGKGGTNLAIILKQMLLIPDQIFTWESLYGKNKSCAVQQKEDSKGPFCIPVHPNQTPVWAYFYSLNQEWNPYYQHQSLRNRALVSSLIDLLWLNNRLYNAEANNFRYIGFNSDYSAYVLEKLADTLPSNVRDAWINILGKNITILRSSSGDNYHEQICTAETDMCLGAIAYLNRLLFLEKKYHPSSSRIAYYQEVRDEWTKLLIDPKSRTEFNKNIGDKKGYLTSGYCTMDGTINASYDGLCFDHLVEIFNLAYLNNDIDYQNRIGATILKNVNLKAYTTTLDLASKKIVPMPICSGSFNNRTNTATGFCGRQSHYSEAAIPINSIAKNNEYEKISFPPLYKNFLAASSEAKKGEELNNMQKEIADKIKELPKVNSIDSADFNFQRAKSYTNEWYLWTTFNSLVIWENYNNHFEDKLLNTPDWQQLPIENNNNYILSFGKGGEEDFYAIRKGNYNLNIFTGTLSSPASGFRSGGLSYFSFYTGTQNGWWYTPILSQWVSRLKKTTVKDNCNPNPADPATFICGVPGFAEWPNNHLIAKKSDGLIYSSAYYEITKKVLTENQSSLTTYTPFYVWDKNWDKNNNQQIVYQCDEGSADQGCIKREFIFDKNSMTVNLDLKLGNSEVIADFVDKSIYEVLPLKYYYPAPINFIQLKFFDENETKVEFKAGETMNNIKKISLQIDQGTLKIELSVPTSVMLNNYSYNSGLVISKNLLIKLIPDPNQKEAILSYKIIPPELISDDDNNDSDEISPTTLPPDFDQDGFNDAEDNCPKAVNKIQVDTDKDGIGDTCDNCKNMSNPYQVDTDKDGFGDTCDNCAKSHNPGQVDDDADKIGNVCDNCPNAYNPGQEDSNNDKAGDSCSK